MHSPKRDPRSHAIVPPNHHDIVKRPGFVPVVSSVIEFVVSRVAVVLVRIQSDSVGDVFEVVLWRGGDRFITIKSIPTPTRKADELLKFAIKGSNKLP